MTSTSRPAGNGWAWIAEGWALFKASPGIWIAIIVALAVIFIVLGLIPILGFIASALLAPVFMAGIAIGCRSLETSGKLEFAHLFAGFGERVGTLLGIGALSLAATVVIAGAVFLVMGGGMLAMMSGDPAAVKAGGIAMLLALLVMLALWLPVAMALWFAPALVVFRQQGAMAAIQQSFVACLRNVLPFLVYGVIGLVLAIFASIPLMLGWLVLGPVLAASIYTAYRDIFPS